MQTIDVQETTLDALLLHVADGETIVLERDGSPVASIFPVKKTSQSGAAPRPESGFGFLKGRFRAPDDIKTPFAAEIEDMFYGNPDKFSDKG